MPSLIRATLALCAIASASAFAPQGTASSLKVTPSVPESVVALASAPTPSDRNSYSEQSRAFRRTVYTWPDWVKHRSPDRFLSQLSKMRSSGLLRALAKEVAIITLISAFVVGWNNLVGDTTGLDGNVYPGLLSGSELPELGLPLTPFTLSSPSLGLLLVFRTNTAYTRWDEARKAWGLNINRSRDLVRMATVWSAAKVEPDDAITRMDPQWAGGQIDEEKRMETLRRLSKMVWAFQRSLMRQLSNPDDEAAFQAQLYERLDTPTAQAIIASTHRPNRAMHEISMCINELPMHFLRRNEVDKDVITFEDTCGGCERLFSSPIPIFYTRHTARFLSAWLLLLPFALWEPFKGSWNHIGMIPAAAVISLFLFGIEELAVQLEEPFSVLPMQGFCDKIGMNCDEIIEWDPNEGKPKIQQQQPMTTAAETNGAVSPIPRGL